MRRHVTYQMEWIDVTDYMFGGAVVALALGAGNLMIKSFDDPRKKNKKASKQVTELCTTCIGLGRVRCEQCEGTGTDAKADAKFSMSRCSTCRGSGRLKCPSCEGRGQRPRAVAQVR
eukprot:EC119791.1.p1 GENE.EC119791.1~~EC119791.1.p1  ORF type:complete len:117 (+),score=1.72 EC119791.1:144-494(+)